MTNNRTGLPPPPMWSPLFLTSTPHPRSLCACWMGGVESLVEDQYYVCLRVGRYSENGPTSRLPWRLSRPFPLPAHAQCALRAYSEWGWARVNWGRNERSIPTATAIAMLGCSHYTRLAALFTCRRLPVAGQATSRHRTLDRVAVLCVHARLSAKRRTEGKFVQHPTRKSL